MFATPKKTKINFSSPSPKEKTEGSKEDTLELYDTAEHVGCYRVFVYGKGMKKYATSDLVCKGELISDNVRTLDKYHLFLDEDDPKVTSRLSTSIIKGELYEVTESVFQRIKRTSDTFKAVWVTYNTPLGAKVEMPAFIRLFDNYIANYMDTHCTAILGGDYNEYMQNKANGKEVTSEVY